MKQSRQVAGGNPSNFLTLAHLSTPHSPKHLLNFLPATRYTSKLRLLCFHLLQHSGKLAFPKYIASRTLHLNRKLFRANLHKDILNILFGALHVPDASPLRTCTFSMIRGSSISPSSLVMHFVVVPPIAVQTHEMHIILLFPRALLRMSSEVHSAMQHEQNRTNIHSQNHMLPTTLASGKG
jgi:hypothetical protein